MDACYEEEVVVEFGHFVSFSFIHSPFSLFLYVFCVLVLTFSSIQNCKSPRFWEDIKPSRIDKKPGWMTFDDLWVDEVRRVMKACVVFLWYPIYCTICLPYLSYPYTHHNPKQERYRS